MRGSNIFSGVWIGIVAYAVMSFSKGVSLTKETMKGQHQAKARTEMNDERERRWK